MKVRGKFTKGDEVRAGLEESRGQELKLKHNTKHLGHVSTNSDEPDIFALSPSIHPPPAKLSLSSYLFGLIRVCVVYSERQVVLEILQCTQRL